MPDVGPITVTFTPNDPQPFQFSPPGPYDMAGAGTITFQSDSVNPAWSFVKPKWDRNDAGKNTGQFSYQVTPGNPNQRATLVITDAHQDTVPSTAYSCEIEVRYQGATYTSPDPEIVNTNPGA